MTLCGTCILLNILVRSCGFFNRALQINTHNMFWWFTKNAYVMGTQLKHLSKVLLMSTQSICFRGEKKNIEDIYSFAVNTINIVIECNENISIFTSAKHE